MFMLLTYPVVSFMHLYIGQGNVIGTRNEEGMPGITTEGEKKLPSSGFVNSQIKGVYAWVGDEFFVHSFNNIC